LGKDAARQVLAGRIRRGDGDSIQAVVLICDLRRFTQMSDEHPRQQLLELLDAYFESVVGAIRSSGGEVLKFMGDAVLAVFPWQEGEEQGMACRRAAQAAKEAHRASAAVNMVRKEDGDLLIDFGVALHFGEVMYGNIGAPDRLDFTVIGPAVNMVSRLEGLCGALSRPILVSNDFSERYGLELEDMGEHALKGIKEPLRVFSLATS
jgi:adenylate cyclase